jgi:hypothetical protein
MEEHPPDISNVITARQQQNILAAVPFSERPIYIPPTKNI